MSAETATMTEGIPEIVGSASAAPYDDFTFNDLIQNPYGTINNVLVEEYDKDCNGWYNIAIKRIESVITTADWRQRARLPCLNVMDEHQATMSHGRVVRFRCMIQELHDPQLYSPVVCIRNRETNECLKRFLVFQDSMEIQCVNFDICPNHPIDPRAACTIENIIGVSVPGENGWLTNLDVGVATFVDKDVYGDETCPYPYVEISGENEKVLLKNKGCRIKIFRSTEILVNDVFEFYGILSNGPRMGGNIHADVHKEVAITEDNIPLMQFSMQVLGYVKDCGNYSKYEKLSMLRIDKTSLLNETQTLRFLLLDMIGLSMMGDMLSAKYILCNLFSNICSRVDGNPIGSFPIHLTLVNKELPKFFADFLSNLVEKNVFIEHVLGKLGKRRFVPEKNYESDRLLSSVLQVSSGTHLIIEEEEYSAEIANELATNEIVRKNIENLQLLIECQRVSYSFGFTNHIEFNHDAPVIILSVKGAKPVLQGFGITVIPFKPAETVSHMQQRSVPRINELMEDKSLISKLRDFIILTKERNEFEISEDMNQFAINEYLHSQHDNCIEKRMGVDDLHRCLTLGRLWSKAQGRSVLHADTWNAVRRMEWERKARITCGDLIRSTSNIQI